MSIKRLFWALVFIGAGTLMILNMCGVVTLPSFGEIAKYILPAILILIGLGILLPSRHHERLEGQFEDIDPTNECNVMFAGRRIDYTGKVFDGISVKASFGGVKMDLRHAEIKDGATIEVQSLFGGVDVNLPDGVDVTVISNSFAGGVNDDRMPCTNPTKKITVKADCVFGGINIK